MLPLQARECFYDLTRDFVADFFGTDPGRTEAGFGRALAREVEEAAGTDAPADADSVILLVTETAGVAVSASAQAAAEGLGTDGGNQRAVNRAVPVVAGGLGEGLALLKPDSSRGRDRHHAGLSAT